MAAIQNLQLWCKQQCEGYRDVSITNMTTSFRDGLAFCAILHRHRPDLINFNSLSKENVYENNKLAFQVASEQLGIPALLDAEDMVALRVPDRLSIITYVSQYYNYFHGRSPIGGMAGIKRSSSELQEHPAGKKAVPEPPKPASPKLPPAHPPAKAKPKEASPVTTKGVLTESGNIRSSCCGICGNHVHLVQRHLVDGKLYHRNCFRCRQCWNVLLPGSYKAGPEPGTFICTSHQQPDSVQSSGLSSTQNKPESTPASTSARAFQKAAEPKKQEQMLKKPSQEGLANSTKPSVPSSGSSGLRSLNTPWSSSAVNKSGDCKGTPLGNKTDHREGTTSGPLWTTSNTKTQQAREKFFQSLESSSNKTSDAKNHSPSHSCGKISSGRTATEVTLVKTEKDQARNHIIQTLAGSKTSPGRPGGLSSTGSSASSSNVSPSSSQSQSPTPKLQTSKTGYTAPKQEKITEPLPRSQTTSKLVESVHKPESKGLKGTVNADEDKSESPAEWRSRLKPVANKDQAGSKKPTDHSQVGTGNPAEKEKKPAPLVVPSAKQESSTKASSSGNRKKLIPSPDLLRSFQNSKQDWEDHGVSAKKEKEGSLQLNQNTVTFKSSITKSIQGIEAVSPTKLHPDYLPEEEIQKKVRDIEKQLDVLELKGVDLEKQLRSCEGDESEDALMVDWFTLIHEKQLLLRQESELMYKMKQQNLEEQQWNIELELRRLVDKPENLKTPREKEREKELLDSYLNTVNDRNNIVECLDEDRIREKEEDQMLADMIRKLDGSLGGQESEKKKNKFRLSKIWKQKDKS
ncbi:MICAL-like protein 2 isoform X2 [Coturnix japonica]|uniref:MICAL-like protein 2 isoform X2 n=1 Tax=Coturnix japonica TaxID=93934 RepID=UPI000777A1BB|nr:MICAL-like protein 2 isoform X2 [Coturnix japonica]